MYALQRITRFTRFPKKNYRAFLVILCSQLESFLVKSALQEIYPKALEKIKGQRGKSFTEEFRAGSFFRREALLNSSGGALIKGNLAPEKISFGLLRAKEI